LLALLGHFCLEGIVHNFIATATKRRRPTKLPQLRDGFRGG
jgi:hypothetical protein